MSIKVLYCEHCKNLLLSIKDVNVMPVCCGEKMHVLVANSTDAAAEKHVPVLEVEGNTAKVTVSDVLHPMLPEHHIEWAAIETDRGIFIKSFDGLETPSVEFALCDDEKVNCAYAYCNLHGFWKSKD